MAGRARSRAAAPVYARRSRSYVDLGLAAGAAIALAAFPEWLWLLAYHL